MPTTPIPGARVARFDPAAAHALASALHNLAWRIETALRVEASAYLAAAESWRGPSAAWAGLERAEVRGRLQRAAGRCRDAAGSARASVLVAAEVQAAWNQDEQVRRARAAAIVELREAKER